MIQTSWVIQWRLFSQTPMKNLHNFNPSVNEIDGAVKQLTQDVTSITQDMNKDFVDTKDKINANITEHIRVMKHVLKEEVCRSNIIIKDGVRF